MQTCIYGAGAGGGHFATRLAATGHSVSVIARGPHLAAIQENGLTLHTGNDTLTARVKASDDPKTLGRQDVVVVAVKATALQSVADGIAPLLHKDTLVIFPQNGMAWWYPVNLPAALPKPPRIPIFDLADRFLRVMQPHQILGGIIYSANVIEAPGVIRNNSPAHNRLEFGPLDDNETAAIAAIRAALVQAGIRAPRPADIRGLLWEKLLTNISGSAIGAATGRGSEACRDDAGLREIYRRIVREGLAIAAAHGFALHERIDPERMLSQIVPNHKASLLQDYEQSRPMEIGEIVLAPLAFARAQNVATPTLDAVAAIVARRAIDRGLYSESEMDAMQLWVR